MGKVKEKSKVKLPKPEDVALAKPLVQKLALAKARFGKVAEQLAKAGEVKRSDPKHRAARKRVKRAQRKLRGTLKYAAQRAKPAPAAADAPAAAAPGS
jgi:benzoyl-CoA reductase/2-hydroxyglutaryl-CoA dehydratase subunit BcrC/BadD/HgdB